MSDEQVAAVSKAVFGKSDGLVDLPGVTDMLVAQVGSRQVLDPFTGNDAIWSFLEAMTSDKTLVRASSLTEYSKLSGRAVAKYLGSNLERGQSFDMVFRTALKLDGTPLADEFFPELMQQLSAYSARNANKLPPAFTKTALQDLYLKLRSANTTLSPALSEVLLFALHRQALHTEAIDLCESAPTKTDIHRHYLAESLLQSSLRGSTYEKAIESCDMFAG